MKKFLLIVAMLILSTASYQPLFAEPNTALENSDYKEQLCGKVKQCRLGQLVAAEMPVFMQDIIVDTVDTQCLTIASGYESQIVAAGLDDEAKKCVHSLEGQSCQELLATQGEANTDECDDFLTLADSVGIDFSKIEF